MLNATKAEILKQLGTQIQSANILPLSIIEFAQWRDNPDQIVWRASDAHLWFSEPLIVRSSSRQEDRKSGSLAGQYDSILNVSGQQSLIDAVNRVFASYGSPDPTDQVFIQPMLQSVKRSGVLFTADPSSGAPYYIVNFSECGDTEAITSGDSSGQLLYLAKTHLERCSTLWIKQLVILAEELQTIFNNNALDIEFGFDESGELYLFQVRPLAIDFQAAVPPAVFENALGNVYRRLTNAFAPHPYLSGKRSLFGVMPDWNPAEIIGIRPKPLSLSLYRELITDSIWAYQRNNYGYKNLRSFPLLQSLNGQPFIDVRVSFNSFIPQGIDKALADKLVDFYIDRLDSKPEMHDKVEFEIIHSCYTLDIEQRSQILRNSGFDENEISELKSHLKTLTNRIINADGLWVKDRKKIDILESRRETINTSDLPTLSKAYWLIEDCKRFGTLPFAGLARAGFMAVQFLKSLVAINVLTQADYDAFMRSVESVGSSFTTDKARLSHEEFLEKYGHLRPGTYDILSPRYDEAPDRYFAADVTPPINAQQQEDEFKLSASQVKVIDQHLLAHDIDHSADSLIAFIKAAIEGREYAKFVFTRSLSDVLKLLAVAAKELDINPADMAYLNIQSIIELNATSMDVRTALLKSIAAGKRQFDLTLATILPPLIRHPDDIYYFQMPEQEPNFITQGAAEGQVIAELDSPQALKDKVVFITSADPGFDWIFSCGIRGLITKYGGANSHMAIRSAELGIPSVIGAGEVLFERWARHRVVHIDAANRKVTAII